VKQLYPLFLLLFVLGISELTAQQVRFDAANDLLEEQQYAEAIEQFKAIADEGYHAGALWLNMGIAYARLDSLGKAKFYLLKAKEYSDTEELASESLSIVENRFSRRSAVLPKLPWEQFLEWLDRILGINGLVVIALLFLNAGAGFLLASWFHPGLKKFYRRSGYTVALLSFLLLSTSYYIHLTHSWYGTGVMIDRQTTVHNEPNSESAAVSTAYEGYSMRVDHRQSATTEEWSYIRLENGRYGWIRSSSILVY